MLNHIEPWLNKWKWCSSAHWEKTQQPKTNFAHLLAKDILYSLELKVPVGAGSLDQIEHAQGRGLFLFFACSAVPVFVLLISERERSSGIVSDFETTVSCSLTLAVHVSHSRGMWSHNGLIAIKCYL